MLRFVQRVLLLFLISVSLWGGIAKKATAKGGIFFDLPRATAADYPANAILTVKVLGAPAFTVQNLTVYAEGIVNGKRVTQNVTLEEWGKPESTFSREYVVQRPELPAGQWVLSVRYDRVVTLFKDGKPLTTRSVGVTQLFALNYDGTPKTRRVEGAKYPLWLQKPVYLEQASETQRAEAIQKLLRLQNPEAIKPTPTNSVR